MANSNILVISRLGVVQVPAKKLVIRIFSFYLFISVSISAVGVEGQGEKPHCGENEPVRISDVSMSDGFVAVRSLPQSLKVYISYCGNPVSAGTVRVSFDNGDNAVVLYDDGEHEDDVSGDGWFGGEWDPRVLGPVTMKISAFMKGYDFVTHEVTGTVRPKSIQLPPVAIGGEDMVVKMGAFKLDASRIL
jgi:hypothetical protein